MFGSSFRIVSPHITKGNLSNKSTSLLMLNVNDSIQKKKKKVRQIEKRYKKKNKERNTEEKGAKKKKGKGLELE